MTILQYGGGSGIGSSEYAIVYNASGQPCTSNDAHALSIDGIGHLGAYFSASLGDSLINLAPGLYLAFCDVYAVGDVLASGYVQGWIGGDFLGPSVSVPCIAAATDVAAGIGVSLITAFASVAIGIYARQTDSVTRSLGGDLCIVRMGRL